MADSSQLDISPECVSSIVANCQEGSTSGQTHDVGVETQCTEPTNQKIGSEVFRNELQENCKSSTGSDEHLQSLSENVTKNSPAEQLGLHPEDVSNKTQGFVTKNSIAEQLEFPHGDLGVYCQTGKTSCFEPVSLEQRNDFGTGALSSEIKLDMQQFGSIQNEKLQSVSENVNTSSLKEQPGIPQDVSKTLEPSNDFGTLSSELAKDQDHFGPTASISELSQSHFGTGAPSCDGDEQLQLICENVNTCFLNKQVGLPCEDVSKTLEQTYNVGCGTSYSKPAEVNKYSGSEVVQDEPLQTIILVPTGAGNELLQVVGENLTMSSLKEQAGSPEDVSKTCQMDKMSCSLQTALDQINESGSGSVHSQPEEQKDQPGSVPAQSEQVKISTSLSTCIVLGLLASPVKAMKKNTVIRHLEPFIEDASKNPTDEVKEPHTNNAAQNSSLHPSETATENASNNYSLLGCKDIQNSSARKKSRSLVSCDRVLRSRSGVKPEAPKLSSNDASHATLESNDSVANISNGKEGKGRKRKKKHRERVTGDEFSRIRAHLRYLLNRINYEKSLIDAYSGEGWKGSSLEKLRPEKELQRATSEILRRKLKIRDLFQRLDSLCAEGMFPESLFDSEGQIDSEDIFCAKCGSKDVGAENDIILCDGACDRGFHQYCLEPPLLSDAIPPDDEGWLCPGCDCKDDCIDLLNESQGTDLLITDDWEKVFPEAASSGQNEENNQGLPSDDSDDNDYDPDGPETDAEDQKEESSSDESEYVSASDGLEIPKSKEEQYLGFPSDDSDDDDFNPDAPDPTVDDKHGSSSSDFSSVSEDLTPVLDDDIRSSENVRGSGEQSSKSGLKKHCLKDEVSSLLESDPGQDGSTPVSRKRHIERLDYKKLHDETYGNVPSSEDEDYHETAAPSKRKKGTGQVTPLSVKGKPSVIKNEVITEVNPVKDEHTPKRKPRQKSNAKDTSSSPTDQLKSSPKSGSTSRRKSSTYRRLGEAVTQQLYTSFKENQYPDRSMKERLAQELGITAIQVSKWFENARHCIKAGLAVPQAMRKELDQGETIVGDTDNGGALKNESPGKDDVVAGSCSQDVKHSNLATPKSCEVKPSNPKGRKRKCRSDQEALDADAETKTPVETNSRAGPVTRRRKSIA